MLIIQHRELIEQLEVMKYKLAEAKKEAKMHQKRASRVQTSVDAEKAEQHRDAGSRQATQQFKQLLVDSGGLSRLTIFNDKWHKKHPYAAKLLFDMCCVQ